MFISVVKYSGYDIEYVKRMPFFSFLDLFETVKNLAEQQKQKT